MLYGLLKQVSKCEIAKNFKRLAALRIYAYQADLLVMIFERSVPISH